MLFSDSPVPTEIFNEHQNEILKKVSKKIVDMQMGVVAVMFLESVKPLNAFVTGSSAADRRTPTKNIAHAITTVITLFFIVSPFYKNHKN